MAIELNLPVSPVDRRRLIGAALSVAALPATSLIPAGPAAATWGTGFLRDWTIDDQWNAYPRYNESIGFGRPKPASRPDIHPVDEFLVDF